MYRLDRFMDHSRTPVMGVFGELYKDNQFICYTVEQPWRDNRPFISCIPAGTYQIEPITTPKRGDTGVLVNHDLRVYATKGEAGPHDRFTCLIHSANWSHQLQGCIAFGEKLSWGKHADNEPALMITNSRNMVNKFLPEMIGETLQITWKNSKP